jgi:hypothetical protein
LAISIHKLKYTLLHHRSTEQRVTETDRHRLGLRVVFQCCLTKFAAYARLAVPSKGQLVMKRVVGVDPDSTRPERVGDLDSRVEVSSVHSGSETIGGVVAHLDDLFFGLEFGNSADRTEDLFLHDLHVIRDVGEDGGLDEVAFVAYALASGLDCGAFFLTLLNITVLVISCMPIMPLVVTYFMILSN